MKRLHPAGASRDWPGAGAGHRHADPSAVLLTRRPTDALSRATPSASARLAAPSQRTAHGEATTLPAYPVTLRD